MEGQKRIDSVIQEMEVNIVKLTSYVEGFKNEETAGTLTPDRKKMLEEATKILGEEKEKLVEAKREKEEAKKPRAKSEEKKAPEPVKNEKTAKPKAHKKNEKFDVFTPFTREEELATATVKQMRDRKYDILSPEFRKVLDRETAEKAVALEKKIAAKNGAPIQQEAKEPVGDKNAETAEEKEEPGVAGAEAKVDASSEQEPGDITEDEAKVDAEQTGTGTTHVPGHGKTYKQKEAQSGANTKRGPEPEQEKKHADPIMEGFKRRVNEINIRLQQIKNELEHSQLSDAEVKKLEKEKEALEAEYRQLVIDIKEYKENKKGTGGAGGPKGPGRKAGAGPEQKTEPENPFRVTLDGLRSEYATKYHNFYKERNKKMGLMNKIRRGMGMSISNEPPIPQELIDLKNQYEKSIFEYGNDLYNKESVRLGSQNLSPDQVKIELDKYKSEVIFKDLILDEEQKLANQKVEDLPMKEKSALGSFFAWYNKLPTWQKRALSIGAVTGVGFAAISMAGAGVAGASVWAGAKILRATTGALVGEGAAYAVGKMATGEINRAKESGIDSSKNVLENLNWDENTFNHAKNQYQQTLSEHAGRMNSIKKKQMYTKILAGGLTTFALNYEDAFIHKPSMHDLFGKGAPVDEAIKATTNTAETVTNTAETATQAPATEVFNVQVSSEGAIRTVEDLKEKLATQFPNKSIAPANIQHILNTNATELSKEWGLFNPDDASGKESATMLKGSTVTLDSKGNITLHNLGKGDTILSGEGAKVYGDQMFDSDHNANNGGSTRLTEGGGKVNINEIPGEHLTEGSVNINEIPGENSVGDNLSLEKEINNIPQSVRDTIVPGSATGASTDVVENIQNQGINLNGHSVEEFNAERIAVLDKSYSRWFSTSGAVAKSAEWDHLQNQSMDKLANPGYDFANTREERLIKHLVKLASREGIDYGGKTATQLVDALAIKNLG